jgi:TRL-like protein family
MRTLWVLGAVSLVVGLGGCMIVDAPIRGVVGTEVKWGEEISGKSSPNAPGAMKEGKACAESIMGLMAHGDATVRTAKANGGIKEIYNIDHSARNFFGIVGEWCTIVSGY